MLVNISEFDIRLLSNLLSDVMDDIYSNMTCGYPVSDNDLEILKFIEKFLNKIHSDN